VLIRIACEEGVCVGCFTVMQARKNEGMKKQKQHFKKKKGENRRKKTNIFEKDKIAKKLTMSIHMKML